MGPVNTMDDWKAALVGVLNGARDLTRDGPIPCTITLWTRYELTEGQCDPRAYLIATMFDRAPSCPVPVEEQAAAFALVAKAAAVAGDAFASVLVFEGLCEGEQRGRALVGVAEHRELGFSASFVAMRRGDGFYGDWVAIEGEPDGGLFHSVIPFERVADDQRTNARGALNEARKAIGAPVQVVSLGRMSHAPLN